MVALGTYSLCRLREGPQRQKQNRNLIKNATMSKHWEWEGKKARQETYSPSPASLCDLRVGGGSGGHLFSLYNEGGPSMPETK